MIASIFFTGRISLSARRTSLQLRLLTDNGVSGCPTADGASDQPPCFGKFDAGRLWQFACHDVPEFVLAPENAGSEKELLLDRSRTLTSSDQLAARFVQRLGRPARKAGRELQLRL
jgi:hypothetical protein